MADGASWSSCSGNFYDSGGPSGSYANGEDMTATLCPAGGSGSAPSSSVTFTTWSVQPGATDELFIHDGTTTADPLIATGNGANSLLGQTFTATGASGCLTFHWVSDPANTFAGWVAQVATGPDAGQDASLTVCTSATAFPLIAQLGGTPDPGGSWTGPGGPFPDNFNPGSDPGGVYTYTVAGTGSCPDSSASVTVTVVQAPDAGTNGVLSVCSTSSSTALFNSLGGSPDVGGSWTGPGGPHDGTYDPVTDAPGVYTYQVIGTPPCTNASATVTVSENVQPDAGTNGAITVCSDDAAFDLFDELGGSPDPGGAWTLGGAPVNGTYDPGTSAAGIYVYTVNGVPPCTNASANVTVTEVAAPDAGINATYTACSDDVAFNMRTKLGGSPQSGGTWTDPLGDPHSQDFDPAVDVAGDYTYTVPGAPPCTDAVAVLTVILRQAPDAGTNGAITLCSTDANVQLLSVLGGTPDANGTWTAPGGGSHSGTFDPGVSIEGTYIYTVLGQSPCADDLATVIVTVNDAPVAGNSASIVRCSDAANVNLFTMLGGTPDGGGIWSGPSVLTGGIFDPGVHTPGVYTYTVAGVPPCTDASATVTVTIIQAPNAGSNGVITVCSTDGAFDLFALLGGSPDGGGTWTAPGGGAHSGNFIPGTDPMGVHTYTVLGTPPCANDIATVTVTVNTAPDAGSNGTLTICSTDPPESLFVWLGGTPDPGGTWTRPGGGAHSGVYDPANVNHPQGVYTYTVAGVAPCTSASATVSVTENQAPNAGNSTTVTRCSTNSPFNLFGVLTGAPNPTGFWLDPSNAPFTNPFVPGTSLAGIYKYVVAGAAPCTNDTAFVTVIVNTAPDAGLNGALAVCSIDASVPLIASLGGSPDGGGTWSGPSPTSGNYNPATMVPGIYTYTVDGAAPCLDASATVTVTESQQPDAGSDGMEQLCSTDPPFNLFSELGGIPDPGGTWAGPSSTTGTYDPPTMAGGVYTYTVSGTAPCTNDQATVTVIENAAPDAGIGDQITVCEGTTSVDLFDGLIGSPDAGGTWNDDDATGQQSGNFFSPTGLPPGNYHFTYTVPGSGDCAAASATVTVNIVSQLDAGTNGTTNVCGDVLQYDLFNAIGGSPQAGGVWLDLDGSGAVSGHYFNASFVAPNTYHFRYLLSGIVGCASDSSLATVTVVDEPNAGCNGSVTVCGIPGSVNLFLELGCTPDAGGTWRKPGGAMHSGTYNPAIDVPGIYAYIVAGSGPCVNDTAFVTVTEVMPPNAGTSGAVVKCSNDGSFNMTALLGGSPSPTGTWLSPLLQVHSSTFVPGFDPQGVWTYTVAGTFPCPNAFATLTITVNQAPSAGNNGSFTICSSAPPEPLAAHLSGVVQAGGSWTNPGGGAHTGIYFPSNDSSGVYTYTVSGTPPCVADQSTVTVFENQEPDAGDPASVTFCSNGPAVNLFSQLGGTPDATGYWTFPGCGGALHSGFFVPGISTPGSYCYHVDAISPCINATTSVSVTVNSPPDPGISQSIVVCSDDGPFALYDSLGGSPDPGGIWSGPGGSSGLFIPGTTAPGTYTYLVEGDPPCADASATITIIVNPAPFAGNDGTVTLCSSDAAVSLFQYLGGSPQSGGTWSNFLGPHSGTFDPGSDPPGVYTYSVDGLLPCSDDVATVTVVVNNEPDAGSNGIITVCNDGIPFPLIDELGSPGPGGAWVDPFGVAHNGIYIPGSSDPGIYTYTIPGVAPCPSDGATVTVIENNAPDAGTSNVVIGCSEDVPFLLFDQLIGSPDAGGDWSDPAGDAFPGGLYEPGTSTPGVYTYFLDGDAPCADASATVQVLESPAPDPGISTAVLICDDAVPFPLIGELAGSPDAGGSWSTPLFGPHSDTFDPAVDGSGSYVYTLPGVAPCTSATSIVQITLVPAPNAGTSGMITACINDPAIDLFTGLGGSFDGAGTWSNIDGVGVLTGNLFDATGVAAGDYDFAYAVTGISPCTDDNATVTVTIASALDAGDNATVQVCENENAVDLFAALGGTPQAGGNWIDGGSMALFGSYFNATLVPEGTTWQFTYILSASAACLRDSAIVTVEVLAGPDAGLDASQQFCNDQSPQNLGIPINGDAGGFWLDPFYNVIPGGIFDPASDPAGTYTYVVPAIGSCPNDSAIRVIGITQAPFAGNNGTMTICSSDAPIALLGFLGGSPDLTGTWTGPGGVPHSGFYVPAIDVPGTYEYEVPGQLGCGNDIATVQVTESQAVDAGLDGVSPVCSSQTPFNMFTYLGGSPDAGGTWHDPGGVLHSATFDPAVDIGGAYFYVVAASVPCPNDTSVLFVELTTAPDPGNDSLLNVCATDNSVDLYAALGGTPDTTGIWQDLDSTSALYGAIFNATLVTPGTYQFQYFVAGVAPCSDDSTIVTVVVGAGMSAGQDSAVTVCGAATGYNLFQALGGAPDPGGTWNDDLGTGAIVDVSAGTLNATVLPVGTSFPFTYLIIDPGCGDVSATVLVTTTPYPDPGGDSTAVLCSTDASVLLASYLSGTPDNTGTWTDPLGTPHTGTFDPALDLPGDYTYTVAGSAPCADSSAVVTMVVNDPPDAGANGILLACDTVTALELFSGLGGSPDAGGSWTDVDLTGALTGGTLNTTQVPAGEYDFLYTMTVEGCGNDDALVTVTVVDGVQVSDTVLDCNEQDRTYTVSFTISGGDPTTYTVSGVPGSITSLAPFIFISAPLFHSQDFTVVVDDQYGCGPVTISGSSPCDFEEEVFVPESFSPNGDGINDGFIIPGIEGYPGNSIVIFNRWGDEVFSADGYDNGAKTWDGTSENALIPGDLPTGTYYYVLDLGTGREPFKGFIYLNR